MKFYNLVFISFFVFLFTNSCRQEIEISFKDFVPKPVINCLFTPEEPFQVHISFSKTPVDTASYNIDNAIVILYGDDNTEEQLPLTDNGIYSRSTVIPREGVVYTLKVKIPDMDEVSATGSVPLNRAEITEIESKAGFKTEAVMGIGEEARIPVQNIQMKFKNNSEKNNCMGVSVVQYATTRHWSNNNFSLVEDTTNFNLGYLNSNDPAILSEGLGNFYVYEMLMFRDINLTEQSSAVQFNIEKESSSKFWLRFFDFSPEAFQYVKSWFIHEYTQDYDFWEVYEPHPLYSNVENGYGVFAGYFMRLLEIYPDSTLIFR